MWKMISTTFRDGCPSGSSEREGKKGSGTTMGVVGDLTLRRPDTLCREERSRGVVVFVWEWDWDFDFLWWVDWEVPLWE